jgi:hypothetical protein
MTRWLAALLPARRRRYGPEIADLLAASDRPVSDAVDVAIHVALWNAEEMMRKPVYAVAGLLAAGSLFGLGYAVAGLADGLVELPRHWWSVAPLAGLVASGVLVFIARLQPESTPG